MDTKMHKGVVCYCPWRCVAADAGRSAKTRHRSRGDLVQVVESKDGEAKVIMMKAGQGAPGQPGPERPDQLLRWTASPNLSRRCARSSCLTSLENGKAGPPAAVQRPGKPARAQPEELKVRPIKMV
jgi:hypothetical protein